VKFLKCVLTILIASVSISVFSQTISGTQLNINATSGTNAVGVNNSGVQSSFNQTSTQNVLETISGTSGNYTTNAFVTTSTTKAQVASSSEVAIYTGAINSTTGQINGTTYLDMTPGNATLTTGNNTLELTSTKSNLLAVGTGTSAEVGWSATGVTGSYINKILVNSSGTSIGSATALTLTSDTTNLTSTTATNINTTGNASTSIGSSGTGSVTLTSGTNSLVVSNSGTTITGDTTVTGNSAVNGNSTVGGTLLVTGTTTTNGITNTGSFTSTGNATIGSGSASSVTVGSATGNSTISMNGNRIQNVGNGTAGTDAVNLNQLNSVSGNVSSLSNSVSSLTGQVNNLNTQLQQSQTQYRSGIAGVAAMNGIGGLNAGQTVNFGIGVGGFAGQAGVAAGGNIRITDNATFKASIAQASNNTAVSGGLTIGF